MLTVTEIENIKSQFKEVITYSQNIPDPQVDKLFEEWLENKRDFIEAMGGNLIYEYPVPVSFELDEKDKMRVVEDFEDLIATTYNNSELASFVYQNKGGFFTNRVVEKYKTNNGDIIPEGMKLLKAFKFFETDKNTLDRLQTAASMLIQEDKIEGTLCLSVHPLDFLSVSENNHNWRSCHALDGEYRAGNLSYMKDKTTIICYLKGKNQEKLPHFPDSVLWNSKKWRVLLFFSENWDMLFAGRQYPFSSNTGIDFVREKLLPLARMNDWSPWTDRMLKKWNDGIREHSFIPPYLAYDANSKLARLNEIITNEPGSLQFNDLLSSSCYEPLYCIRLNKVKNYWKGFCSALVYNTEAEEKEDSEDEYILQPCNIRIMPRIKIGGAVHCLHCGNKKIELTESMMCNECELEYGTSDSDMFTTCSCCGTRFYYEDSLFVDSTGELICPSCADEYTSFCANCGSLFYNDDLCYDSGIDDYYCKHCYEDLKAEGEIKNENFDDLW